MHLLAILTEHYVVGNSIICLTDEEIEAQRS